MTRIVDQYGSGGGIRASVTEKLDDYELLDSGAGRKLERFGVVTVDRPEPQAMWSSRLDSERWKAAHAVFDGDEDENKGRWSFRGNVPDSWTIGIEGVALTCRFSAFRHLGVFPEQHSHWRWMVERLTRVQGERPRLLNLFGYTGAASLMAARAGAEVTHVDASRKAIEWARVNQAQSTLDQAPIRWILDDARKFARRDVRRKRLYHGILLDPPKFGRGPDGEVWDLFTDLPEMLRTCARLLDPSQSFLILTTYAVRASSVSFDTLCHESLAGRGGTVESGELILQESGGGRFLSTSLYTRWSSDGLGE